MTTLPTHVPPRMTAAQARAFLHDQLPGEVPEERPEPPRWQPFTAMHSPREVLSAVAAVQTRREHLKRLIDLPDRALAQMLARGWDPRDRGQDPSLAAPTVAA